MTTEQCLLNSNRNPSLSMEQVEDISRDTRAAVVFYGSAVVFRTKKPTDISTTSPVSPRLDG